MAKKKAPAGTEGALAPKKEKKVEEEKIEEIVYLVLHPKDSPMTVPLSRYEKNLDIYSRYIRVYPKE